MAVIRNKYAGKCRVCGTNVPVGAGVATNDRGRWETCCSVHNPAGNAAAEASGPPTVEIQLRGDMLVYKPTTYLGGDWFTKFQTATAAGRYDMATKSKLSTVPQVVLIKPALEAEGFRVVATPEAVSVLQVQAANAAASAKAADERLDLPMAAKLFPFQRAGVRWLASRPTGMLADEQGLGKTIQALLSIPSNPQASALIIVPASLKLNWRNEIRKWRPDLTPVVLEGKTSFRWPKPHEAVILNYDILPPKVPENIPQQIALVADEVQAVKNPKAIRTTRFRDLSKAVRLNAGWVWIMTGTPLLNRPQETWNILEAADLAREAFGKFDTFRRLMGGEQGKFGIEWGGAIDPSVPDLLRRVSLRRMKKDVLTDLPPKTYKTVEIDISAELSARERAALDAANAAWEERGEGIEIDAIIDEAKKTQKEGATFRTLSKAREILARAKTPAAIAYIEEQFEETDTPVIVFADHLAPVQALGAREGWATITGETPVEERQRIVDDFQGGRLKGVALTITAGGTGLTLTRAQDNVFIELNWVPANNLQAEDRVHRIGQQGAVTIHRLVANHALDERILATLAAKMDMIRASVDASTMRPDEAVKTSTSAFVDTAAGVTTGSRAFGGGGSRQVEAAPAQTRIRVTSEHGNVGYVLPHLTIPGKFVVTFTHLTWNSGMVLPDPVVVPIEEARRRVSQGAAKPVDTVAEAVTKAIEAHQIIDPGPVDVVDETPTTVAALPGAPPAPRGPVHTPPPVPVFTVPEVSKPTLSGAKQATVAVNRAAASASVLLHDRKATLADAKRYADAGAAGDRGVEVEAREGMTGPTATVRVPYEKTWLAYAAADRMYAALKADGWDVTAERFQPKPPKAPEPRHLAATPNEHHVVEALRSLIEMDGDRAREENSMGFNKMDGEYGRDLYREATTVGLTDRGWRAAIRFVNKYRRQVGAPPEGLPELTAEEKEAKARRAAKRKAEREAQAAESDDDGDYDGIGGIGGSTDDMHTSPADCPTWYDGCNCGEDEGEEFDGVPETRLAR